MKHRATRPLFAALALSFCALGAHAQGNLVRVGTLIGTGAKLVAGDDRRRYPQQGRVDGEDGPLKVNATGTQPLAVLTLSNAATGQIIGTMTNLGKGKQGFGPP